MRAETPATSPPLAPQAAARPAGPAAPGGPAPEVSVVVPVHRNASTLVELLDRLDAALAAEDRETILVVDGSPDASLAVLLDELPRRPGLVVLELAGNHGQHAALCAGFAAARGRVALVLDADLQQRPEDLPRLLERWRAGYDFVGGRRTERRDPLGRRLGSWAFGRLARLATGVPLADWGSPIAAIDRSILERIPRQGEERRFLKPLVARLARRWTEVDVASGAPSADGSSYSPLRLVGVALDFLVAFSHRPFQRLVGLGTLAAALSVALGLGYLALRVLGVVPASPATQAVVVLGLFGGLQVLVLGALGEFTHRIYRLVQGRPLYEVRARHEASAAPPAAERTG